MMVFMEGLCFLPLSLLHQEDGLWGRDQVPREKKPSWILWKHSLLDHTDPTPMGLQDQGLTWKHGPHFTVSLKNQYISITKGITVREELKRIASFRV